MARFEDAIAGTQARLSYLSDIFSKLNELNLALHGKDKHVLNYFDEVCGIIGEVQALGEQM